jgi:hypothetical protein
MRAIGAVLIGVAALMVGAATWLLWPRCSTWQGLPGLAPPETTCASHSAPGWTLAILAVLVGSVALRIVSDEGSRERRGARSTR